MYLGYFEQASGFNKSIDLEETEFKKSKTISFFEYKILIIIFKVEISTEINNQNNIASIIYFIGFLKSLIHDRKCSTSLTSRLN